MLGGKNVKEFYSRKLGAENFYFSQHGDMEMATFISRNNELNYG
jgi:hypothetical protein